MSASPTKNGEKTTIAEGGWKVEIGDVCRFSGLATLIPSDPASVPRYCAYIRLFFEHNDVSEFLVKQHEEVIESSSTVFPASTMMTLS